MHQPSLRFALIALGCCLASCSIQNQLLQTAGNAVAIQGNADEEDLEIAQNASAFYIKLSESMLQKVPDNVPLALSTTATLTQYAYAFVSTPADRIEGQNTQQAFSLRNRAAKLYTRAKAHGLKALELQQPGLLKTLETLGSEPAKPQAVRSTFQLKPKLAALAYWSAASWAGAISLSKDSPEVVADLPQVFALAQLAFEAEPHYGQGALASLMGTLEMAKTQGNKKNALAYFDLAIDLSKHKDPGALVSKAENYALPMVQPQLFESLLKEALECTPNKNDVATQVMQTRSRWLLDHVEDYF